MYCVTIITYEDDYKHRYDSGVYPEPPMFFKTKEEAMNYVRKEIINHVSDRKGISRKELKKLTLDELSDHLEGSYINETLTYEIDEVTCV